MPFDKKEDYLELLELQIQNKKAKKLVIEEFEQHIEDQKAAFMKDGLGETSATKSTLEQMGDPEEVGKQLNKIHRPRMEWNALLMVFVLCSIGILIQFSMNSSGVFCTVDFRKQIIWSILGFFLMLIIYFIDYSIVGKYPKIIWLVSLSSVILLSLFTVIINGAVPILYVTLLLIPLYGGIIYAHRKCGYKGIISCLLFCFSGWIVQFSCKAQSSVHIGFLLSCLILLTTAVANGWFGTAKIKSFFIIWGWPLAFIPISYRISGISIIRERIAILMSPESFTAGYQTEMLRKAISHSRLFGKTTESVWEYGHIPLTSQSILTYVICTFGIIAGLSIIALFIAFIGRMIYISLKQKNSLGIFVGLGCTLAFAIQGILYIGSNLGYPIIIFDANLPFISYSGTAQITNFIILGLILSIFRNSNIIKETPYKSRFPIKLSIKAEWTK